ncbi:MAG: hypothetical protein IKZ94_01860, partial [Lachnospiraceae bacterium]|nr:hypothetical protein [Lachnospiraceae bacterium]
MQFLRHAFAHDYESVLIIDANTLTAQELVGSVGDFSENGKIENVDVVTSRFFIANVLDIQVEELIRKTRMAHILEELSDAETYTVQFESRNKRGMMRSYQTEFAYIDRAANTIIASTTDITETVRQNKNQRELISVALERLDKATRARESFFAN